MDWQDFKSTDKEVQEELDAHSRSDKQYLDRQVRGAVHSRHCSIGSRLACVETPLRFLALNNTYEVLSIHAFAVCMPAATSCSRQGCQHIVIRTEQQPWVCCTPPSHIVLRCLCRSSSNVLSCVSTSLSATSAWHLMCGCVAACSECCTYGCANAVLGVRSTGKSAQTALTLSEGWQPECYAARHQAVFSLSSVHMG